MSEEAFDEEYVRDLLQTVRGQRPPLSHDKLIALWRNDWNQGWRAEVLEAERRYLAYRGTW